MEGKYTFNQFSDDLDNGYKIMYDYVRNRYMVYKVSDNCYMSELVELKTKNPVPEKSMITLKARINIFIKLKESIMMFLIMIGKQKYVILLLNS